MPVFVFLKKEVFISPMVACAVISAYITIVREI
jgi:hypothetical protein